MDAASSVSTFLVEKNQVLAFAVKQQTWKNPNNLKFVTVRYVI